MSELGTHNTTLITLSQVSARVLFYHQPWKNMRYESDTVSLSDSLQYIWLCARS